ncbi:hypothetical protein BLOT_004661 [Blomia tropicalis]|nr:hypothetical protein BLOT_004661 [Blomia tropicalis]
MGLMGKNLLIPVVALDSLDGLFLGINYNIPMHQSVGHIRSLKRSRFQYIVPLHKYNCVGQYQQNGNGLLVIQTQVSIRWVCLSIFSAFWLKSK